MSEYLRPSVRHTATLLLAGLLAGSSAAETSAAEASAPFTLQNDYWSLTVEPQWGARLSSMRSLTVTQDFVSVWGDVMTDRQGRGTRDGGILRSMMSGSYHSSQPQDPYKVLRQDAISADLVFDNPYPLLDGLREERRIALEGQQVVFSVKVTNTGSKPRVIYYRTQDYAGVGNGRGRDSVYAMMREAGTVEAFAREPGKSVNYHVLNPAEPWFALADLVDNRGLLVTFAKALPTDIFFWVSGTRSTMCTAEIFFPQAKLMPGQSWEMEARYTAFAPGNPQTGEARLDAFLAAESLETALGATANRGMKAAAPFHADLELETVPAAVTLTPVHPSDGRALGGSIAPDYGRTLKRIRLYGTPGEVASFAFTIRSTEPLPSGKVRFEDLASDDGKVIGSGAFEPAYVAGGSLVLVHDWELSRNLPEESGAVNNNVVDAEALTPFVLKPGDMAPVWSRLRIPADAAAGNYTGRCVIGSGDTDLAEFEIELTVRPFKLIRPEDKTYGTFFVYYLKPQQGEAQGEKAEKAISREEYAGILKAYGDAGCNGFAIYVSRRDDLLWVLDCKRELGMNGVDVLISPSYVNPVDVSSRGMKAYAWGVDEPSNYWQVPGTLKKYKLLVDKGWTPTFTPNLPLGLLMADQMEKMVPIINCNGNAPYLMAASQRYKDEGRDVLWYECYGLGMPSIEQRLLRGIYLWKEPVDGIIDWDNGGGYDKLSEHNMIAFAGCRPLFRLGLENTRQALTDLAYLHTLEEKARMVSDTALRGEAEQLMTWIRTRFGADYHRVMLDLTDPQYLDDVRQQVAEMIVKLTGE